MLSDTEVFALVDESPTLSQGSKVAYTKQLRSAQKALDGNEFRTILLDPSVVEHLNAPLATRIAYTNALNSLFKRDREVSAKHNRSSGRLDFVSKATRDQWSQVLTRLHADRDALVDKNTRSKREVENWVTSKEWEEMDLTLSETQRGSPAQLLVAFNTRIPPPRGGDLAQVRICDSDADCPEGNILVYKGSTPHLLIRDHKTRRKYGPIRIPLPSTIEQDVIVSLEERPRDFLFTDSHNEMYPSRDAFMTWKTNTLRRLFKRDVTSNIARREFATSEDMNAPLHSLKRSAAAMGHSVETHHAYRVVPKDEIRGGTLKGGNPIEYLDVRVHRLYKIQKLPGGPGVDSQGVPVPTDFFAYVFHKNFPRGWFHGDPINMLSFSCVNLNSPTLPLRYGNWREGVKFGKPSESFESVVFANRTPLDRCTWFLQDLPAQFFSFEPYETYTTNRATKIYEQLGRAETKEYEEKRQDWEQRREQAGNEEMEMFDKVNDEALRKPLPAEILHKISTFHSPELADRILDNVTKEYQNIPAYAPRGNSGYIKPDSDVKLEGGTLKGGSFSYETLVINDTYRFSYLFAFRHPEEQFANPRARNANDRIPVIFLGKVLEKVDPRLLTIRVQDTRTNIERVISLNEWEATVNPVDIHNVGQIGRHYTGLEVANLGKVAEFLGLPGAEGRFVRENVADKALPGQDPSLFRRGGGWFSSLTDLFSSKQTPTSLQKDVDLRDLQHMCEEAYALFNDHYPSNVGKWDLIRQTREDLLYRHMNTFVVAVRGTQGSPTGEDWSANRTIPINGLASTARCKKDLQTVTEWREQFTGGVWYATGHSLGGAICDELLRIGLVTEAYTFNPAVQTKDFNGKLPNRRIYARGDPLYQLFGRFTKGAILQPAESFGKELLTLISPTYFASNALQQHNLSAFDAHPLQGGMEGGMAVKAAMEMVNAKTLYNGCVNQAWLALSSYYKELKPLLEKTVSSSGPSAVPVTLNEEEELKIFEDAGIPIQHLDFRPDKRGEDIDVASFVRTMKFAQDTFRGGVLSVNVSDTRTGENDDHAVMYVGDPVTGKISFYDPLRDAEGQRLTTNLRGDFHLDAHDPLFYTKFLDVYLKRGNHVLVLSLNEIDKPIDAEAKFFIPTDPVNTASDREYRTIKAHVEENTRPGFTQPKPVLRFTKRGRYVEPPENDENIASQPLAKRIPSGHGGGVTFDGDADRLQGGLLPSHEIIDIGGDGPVPTKLYKEEIKKWREAYTQWSDSFLNRGGPKAQPGGPFDTNKATMWAYRDIKMYDTSSSRPYGAEETESSYATGLVYHGNDPSAPRKIQPVHMTVVLARQYRETGTPVPNALRRLGMALWSFVDPQNIHSTEEGPWIDVHYLVATFPGTGAGAELLTHLKQKSYKGAPINGLILEPLEQFSTENPFPLSNKFYKKEGFREVYRKDFSKPLANEDPTESRTESLRWLVWENPKVPQAALIPAFPLSGQKADLLHRIVQSKDLLDPSPGGDSVDRERIPPRLHPVEESFRWEEARRKELEAQGMPKDKIDERISEERKARRQKRITTEASYLRTLRDYENGPFESRKRGRDDEKDHERIVPTPIPSLVGPALGETDEEYRRRIANRERSERNREIVRDYERRADEFYQTAPTPPYPPSSSSSSSSSSASDIPGAPPPKYSLFWDTNPNPSNDPENPQSRREIWNFQHYWQPR
jgi:hypothetical protein